MHFYAQLSAYLTVEVFAQCSEGIIPLLSYAGASTFFANDAKLHLFNPQCFVHFALCNFHKFFESDNQIVRSSLSLAMYSYLKIYIF